MVLDLNHNSLMSAINFADSQYITVLTPTEVLVYDNMDDLQRSISSTAILRGRRCKHSRLWRVPLKPVVRNNNTDTKLIDQPNPEHAINIAYDFELVGIRDMQNYTSDHLELWSRLLQRPTR